MTTKLNRVEKTKNQQQRKYNWKKGKGETGGINHPIKLKHSATQL